MSETGSKVEASPLPNAAVPSLSAQIAGVALTSPEPQKLARFYTDNLGYAGGWHCGVWSASLDGRWLSISEGAANAIDHVAFALPDDEALLGFQSRLDAASVTFEAALSPFVSGGALGVIDPDGNRLVFGLNRQPAEDGRGVAPCRLQHIVFASDDAAKMVFFYCDVLGFAPSDYVKKDTGDLTSAFLRCGSEHHSLAIFRAPRKRLDHLCFDVADWLHIRDWADAFAKQHITLRWGPGRHGPGDNLFFFVNDPDGNWLEFSAELETVDGPREIGLWPHEERTLNYWGAAILRS